MVVKKLKFDEIGYWSEVKLDIVREYSAAYSQIISKQSRPPFYHVYIDAFSGAGRHISKTTKEFIPGSPLNALLIQPKFKEFHFIDLCSEKVKALTEIAGERQDVKIYEGDCNEILLKEVFPQVKWEAYRRGLCLLDPYGLHLNWDVMWQAGQMKSIDIFLNFPTADMNRNVLLGKPENADSYQVKRMTAFWGDESWRNAAYYPQPTLFGDENEKQTNERVVMAFCKRLRNVAGFKNVPKPIAMRNSKGAVLYYLVFASQKPVAEHIVKHIFNKHKDRRS